MLTRIPLCVKTPPQEAYAVTSHSSMEALSLTFSKICFTTKVFLPSSGEKKVRKQLGKYPKML